MQVKIVGLTLTHNLSWSPHIKKIAANANRALALLRRARPVLSSPALSTICKSFVRSRMEYCSPLWMGAPATVLGLLDRVQSKAAKLLGPASASQLQTLAHRRGVAGHCLMHRLLHSTAPTSILDLCPSRHSPLTTRRTRASPQFFALPRIRTSDARYWTRSFIPLFSSAFNSLPSRLQTISGLQPFKELVNSSVDLSFL